MVLIFRKEVAVFPLNEYYVGLGFSFDFSRPNNKWLVSKGDNCSMYSSSSSTISTIGIYFGAFTRLLSYLKNSDWSSGYFGSENIDSESSWFFSYSQTFFYFFAYRNA